MCIAHDHYRNAGFKGESFVVGDLSVDTARQRSHDVAFDTITGIVERDMLPAHSDDWASVKGKAIIDFLLTKQIQTNRNTVAHVKRKLFDVLQGNMTESYQTLKSYMREIAAVNPGFHYGISHHENGVFKQTCFFPASCLQAPLHCRHIIGLDGTHLKGEVNKRGVFLLATTKDVNRHIIVFGLALVAQEDGQNWEWFVGHMKEAIAQFGQPWKPAFVSDRQKGLLAAITKLYPASGHRFCVRHINSNMEKLTSTLEPSEKTLIFQMARSECEKDYKFYSSKLADTRPIAAEYLSKIDKAHWVTYAFSETNDQPTCDEVTSNLSESANQWLGNSCHTKYPLEAFEHYFVKVVEVFARRRRDTTRMISCGAATPVAIADTRPDSSASAPKSYLLAPLYKQKITSMLAVTKRLHILPCLTGLYMVRFTDLSSRPDYLHLWRTVNLVEKECTCRRWQDEQFPCVHAVKAAVHHGTHISDLFDWEAHTTHAFRSTYFYQFVPAISSTKVVQGSTLLLLQSSCNPKKMVNADANQGPNPNPNARRHAPDQQHLR